jgi:hypothetical protein
MRLKTKRDIISGIEQLLLDTMSKYMSVDEIKAEAEHLSEFALNDLKEVESTLVAPALSRIEGWNRSKVDVVVSDVYDGYEGIDWSISIYVGSASFTHMGDNHIEDILEDPQDFSSSEEMEDYQNLVGEIKEPGSTKTKTEITLYTAQPKGFDRNRYVEKGLFLTSDYSDAIGLAHDRGREVFELQIPRKDVVETKSGRIHWYQVIRRTKATIRPT